MRSVSVLCCVVSLQTALKSMTVLLYDVCYFLFQSQMFVLSYVLQVRQCNSARQSVREFQRLLTAYLVLVEDEMGDYQKEAK